jgi:hypothetical protein
MALSRNLRRIGMAAHIERIEIRQHWEDISNPDSPHWRGKLADLMTHIRELPDHAREKFFAVWDSETVPEYTSYKKHFLYAAAILAGDLHIITRAGD